MPGISNSTDRFNGVVTSLAIKVPCKVVSIADLTLNGEQTVNGIAVTTGDRVLVNAQDVGAENGIYDVTSTEWDRAADWDGNRDATERTLVLVGTPTPGVNVMFQCDTTGDIVIGSTAVSFSVFISGGSGAQDLESVTSVGDFTGGNNIEIDSGGFLLMRNPGNTELVDINVNNTMLFDGNGQIVGFVFTNYTGFSQFIDVSGRVMKISGTGAIWRHLAPLAVEGIDVTHDETYVNYNHTGGGTGTLGIRYQDDLSLFIDEKAAAHVDLAGVGQFWVRDDVPNVPMFTDDDGTDQLLDPSVSDLIPITDDYTFVLGDKGKTAAFTGSTAAVVVTIPAEASVDYRLGTFLALNNSGSVTITIEITTDTLTWADDNTTGSLEIAAGGYAVAQKIGAASWKIAGKQISRP